MYFIRGYYSKLPGPIQTHRRLFFLAGSQSSKTSAPPTSGPVSWTSRWAPGSTGTSPLRRRSRARGRSAWKLRVQGSYQIRAVLLFNATVLDRLIRIVTHECRSLKQLSLRCLYKRYTSSVESRAGYFKIYTILCYSKILLEQKNLEDFNQSVIDQYKILSLFEPYRHDEGSLKISYLQAWPTSQQLPIQLEGLRCSTAVEHTPGGRGFKTPRDLVPLHYLLPISFLNLFLLSFTKGVFLIRSLNAAKELLGVKQAQ